MYYLSTLTQPLLHVSTLSPISRENMLRVQASLGIRLPPFRKPCWEEADSSGWINLASLTGSRLWEVGGVSMMLKDAGKRCLKQSFWITNETTRAESSDAVELVILEKTKNEY